MAHIRDSTSLCLYGLTMAMVGMVAAADPTIKLSSGNEIPVIGFGTWQIKPEEVEAAVTAALDNGYRHIDTAMIYGNLEGIGKALKAWFDEGNKREDVFITSMVITTVGNRAAEVEGYALLTLKKLGLDYFDLYSIQWPTGFYMDPEKSYLAKHANGSFIEDYDTDHVALWKAMETQFKAGRAKSIGLSNFNETQFMNVYDNAEIKPSNLQVEWHIYLQQRQLLETCRKNDVVVTSYSTLGAAGQTVVKTTKSSQALPKQLENPTVQKIAQSRGRTPAQTLLRHAVENDLVVIPKSVHPERIRENHEIFDFLGFPGLGTHPHYPFSDQLKNMGTYDS